MKKILLIFSSLAVSLFDSQTLSTSENFIYSRTYLEPVTVSFSNAKQLQNVQYLDGLQRVTQNISIKSSPNGKDLVIPVMYDDLGRQTKSFLPLPVDSQNGAHFLGIGESSVNGYYGVSNAYSEILYEKSPLGRAEKKASPGTDWQIGGNHVQSLKYYFNGSNEVKKYKVTTSWNSSSKVNDVTLNLAPDDAYSSGGYYGINSLNKLITKDEDTNETHTFTNSSGQSILIRQINKTPNGSTEKLDTYYLYDEFGNLSFILPPKASISEITASVLDQLCYQYKYDKYNRLAERKIAGKGWEYFVYDNQNRLVATQDANLKAKGQWLYTKYDSFGRIAITGLSTGASRAEEQSIVDAMGLNNLNRVNYVSFNRQGMDVYYDNPDTTYPYSSKWIALLSLNYYDTYPAGSPIQPGQIQNQSTLASVPATVVSHGLSSVRSTQTFPTASYTKNIEDDYWSSDFIWYDTLGRTIGTHSVNHLGGYTKTETELDFTGFPKKTFTYHARRPDEPGVTIRERFVYDNQMRLKQYYHKVDDKPEVLLSENTYNDLSQLINKKVGNNLQSIDYSYNIRGWLTDINKNQMQMSDLGGKLFAYSIKYNQKDGIDNPDPIKFAGKNVKPKYNGTIAEIDWKTVEVLGVNPSLTPKRYGYSYDHANRLIAGYYQNPDNPYSRENTESLSYDLNGNIQSLYRTSVAEYGSNTATVIDNLSYTYTGNQATKITDATQNPTGYRSVGSNIGYDANGNIVIIPDKGISVIQYNYLNLPYQLKMQPGMEDITIDTKYNSSGTKLRKENTTIISGFSGQMITKSVTDYLDGFQYQSKTTTNSGVGWDRTELLLGFFIICKGNAARDVQPYQCA
ncbi:DUF6443 domain-containing protein [Chryseobacterium fluminis]|uniref:DUF6443 domain-containing protein n=1 Tax=Chryseobacterium fluminis TaxID=2983606 RepID=UPI00224FBB4B|nr:DUF6443 domain-containing protein [Chryseobacterium sp. MMS21-Ot14]UZT98207.1 DUF6443 domain-containing protein [Chryseobacterium sp. MMS21-Ot14]